MAGGKTDSRGKRVYARWFDFMEPSFCASDAPVGAALSELTRDGNVVKTVVGFWLRRQLDGTAQAWHDALVRLLEAYDEQWLAQQS